MLQSKPVQLIIRTLLKWQRDECSEMGAALAYYGIFSLFPLLLVILSIVGFLLGADTPGYNQLLIWAESSFPPLAYGIVVNTLLNLNQSSIGAGQVGFLLLLFTASNIFGALDRFVSKIWQVRAGQQTNQSHNHLRMRAVNFLKGRLLAFGLVLGTAALMLLSLVSSLAIDALLTIVDNFSQAINSPELDTLLLLKGLQKGTIFLLLSLAIMVLLKILPSTKVAWGDVWLGGLITASLFRLLQYFVSHIIIQIGSRFLFYGLVGSVMLLLLWIYLTCQVFLLGCEFTYVYAHLFGSRCQRENTPK